MHINLSKLWEIVKDREAWHAVVHRATKSDMTMTEQQKLLHAEKPKISITKRNRINKFHKTATPRKHPKLSCISIH